MEIFCTIYYVLSYLCTIPQMIKLLKTKSSNDYSLAMTLMYYIGVVSWTIYIFTTKQHILVYIGTVIDLLLLTIVDMLIFKYYNFKKGRYHNDY